MTEPRWHPDPLRRHELRYWDGQAWTAHVSDHGTPAHDPLDTARSPVSRRGAFPGWAWALIAAVVLVPLVLIALAIPAVRATRAPDVEVTSCSVEGDEAVARGTIRSNASIARWYDLTVEFDFDGRIVESGGGVRVAPRSTEDWEMIAVAEPGATLTTCEVVDVSS